MINSPPLNLQVQQLFSFSVRTSEGMIDNVAHAACIWFGQR